VVQRELEAAWLTLRPRDAAKVQVQPSSEEALRRVRQLAAAPEAQQAHVKTDVLVTGSLLLVGGVMAHLKDAGDLDDALVSTRT